MLIISTQKCVKKCSIKEMTAKLCILNYEATLEKGNTLNNTKDDDDNNINGLDLLMEIIEEEFLSEDYNTSRLEKGEDDIIQHEKMTITLTTTENQKNNTNFNMTKIDLGECEKLLRHENNIPNETLYMKKIDVIQEGMKIPKIEFNVYYKSLENKLVKLNLSICENNKAKISLFIPVEITENLDKLNTSSKYYNDICSKAKSNNGTDILPEDRKIEFIEGNKTVCQEECDFSHYNDIDKIANCSCKVIEPSQSVADIKIDKEKLYEKLGDIKNKNDFSNLGITQCNVLSSTENIKSNVGFYLLLIIIAIFVIIFIIFCERGYNLLENKMDEVIYKKFKEKRKSKTNKIKKSIINESNKKGKEIIPKSKNSKNSKNLSIRVNNSNKVLLNNNHVERKSKRNSSNIIRQKINTKNNESKPDTDYELNWSSYENSIKFDKRTKCKYYFSLITSKQLFIFTFCSFNDYNSGIIKKFIFFLSFAVHYTVNALFFTESNLHQIYIDQGEYNFEYQSKFILFSFIISTIILRLILQFLVLTDKDILEVKLQHTKNIAINMKKTKLKYMKIKFAIFFVLNLILLGFFWYYLTSFNAIYENTQVYLIINTLVSFGISLFYPFIINIFPMIIRFKSLHSKKKNQEYLYKISQIIQVI